MAPAVKKLLAVDANIPFDLAAQDRDVENFRSEFIKHGFQLVIGPTAIQEISLISERDDAEDEDKKLAQIALQCMLSWGISPFNLQPVGHGLTERFADKLIRDGLLPEDECNDGMILAEASLAGIPALVTSDHHLLDIDRTALTIAFNECDLRSVEIVHPRRFYDTLRRLRG
jgi:hypothetical protein